MMPEIQSSPFSPAWAFSSPLLQWQFLTGLVPAGWQSRGQVFGMKKGFTPCRGGMAWFGLGFAELQ